MRILPALIVFILFTTHLIAQEKDVNKADEAFQQGKYYEAIDCYKKALINFHNKHFLKTTTAKERKALKAKIIFQVAECFRLTGDLKHAIEEYQKAINAHYSDSLTAANYMEGAQKQLNDTIVKTH